MDYKVVTPAEYYSNGEAAAANGAGFTHLPLMPNGAPVAYPFHPNDGFAYANPGAAIRPPNGPPPPGTTTYFTPQQGYFQAPSANAANLPNVSYASANPATAPPGQVPLQRRPPTGRAINAEPITKDTQQQHQNANNPKRFDGAGDVDEEKSPDEILQLLFNKKGDVEDDSSDVHASGVTSAGREDEDLINSDLDDDDEDDEDDEDEDDVDAGTMDENVLLCQYEKVARTRNKWRCVFKSGLIHVNGVDYAFSRANGEFEW